ncbi:MAG: hypothetical protein ACRDWA_08150 [Acidimicrobiia bacterium]
MSLTQRYWKSTNCLGVKTGNAIDRDDHVSLDMNEADGEEDRKTQRTADGVATAARLHDSEEIGHCLDSDTGAPEPPHVEVGRRKAAVSVGDFDQIERAPGNRWSERLVRGRCGQ